MSKQLPFRSINNGNIFARSEKISEIFHSGEKNFCIITKEENIKKYSQILSFFQIPNTPLTSIHDICDVIESQNGVFLATPEIFECQTPNLYEIENKSSIEVRVGENIEMNTLIKKLSDFGYIFRDFLEGGDFKRLGDIIHIKPRQNGPVYTISFWGDEIEGIMVKNETEEKLEKIRIGSQYKIDIFSASLTKTSGFLECVFAKNPLLILDNIDTYSLNLVFEKYEKKVCFDILKIAGDLQTNHHTTDLMIENISSFKEILGQKKKEKIVYSKSPKVIEKFLDENDISGVQVISTNLNILKSYQNQAKIVICDDNLSKIFIKKRSKKTLSENLDLLLQIKSGDYVVHTDHGIGIFHSIIEKEVGQIKKEYLEIHYKDNDKLFVPITEIRRIGKYVGAENPKLTGLNTKEWSKKLEKVGEDIYVIAQELLEIYAQRKITTGFSFEIFESKMQKFQNSFDYNYTPDQENAILDILQDMQKPTPMERILVGDVGFGKTEVAFNAVYNAFLNKKQSIIISPLVVLAYEHYEKARERFADFGLNIGVLTRFEKPEIAKRTIEDLKNGKLDLVIGTHRLLNESIVYNNLGLLVIDEEHKFGVKEKEAIKKLKGNIDILSMSATPIPRSLNMALNGIKEVSILAHPPSSRLPIETYISKFDDNTILEAGHKEFARGGQLYFIHNRVETIETMQGHLQKLFPDKSIVIAHGQLHGDELENRIIAFKQKRYDILLASTVIENGIDFPNVNTIIINDAYKFGISQIHQLRGRVGRSDKQGYCLLLFSKDKINEDAAKRLSTIVEYSHLGAGFELAVKDLEIRGGGDILGIKQSGKASEVGINLYLKMLEQKIEELKYMQSLGENTHTEYKKIETTLELNVEAYIEGHLFQNELDKINFYKEIETIHHFDELESLIEEFTSQNENLSPCNYNLFSLLKVRIQASTFGITSIKRIGVSYHIDFHKDTSLEELKKFLDCDTQRYFSVVDLTKLKCVVSKFKNDTEFLHYLESILFPKPKSIEKVRKIIKLKK